MAPLSVHSRGGGKKTEAPAEMNFHFPQFKVLNLAENGCHTMHNLCPIRGAKTRDALAWSKYLDAALDDFIEYTDVVIAQHHWPSWDRERARKFITEQRDLYRLMAEVAHAESITRAGSPAKQG